MTLGGGGCVWIGDVFGGLTQTYDTADDDDVDGGNGGDGGVDGSLVTIGGQPK